MGLEILSDLSEILPYPIPDFPLYAGIGKLANQNQYTVGCHFHPDFEFNLVLEGVMDYFINGENVHLGTGDGIFVNSQRLHYNVFLTLSYMLALCGAVVPMIQSDAHGDIHDAKWLSLYDMTKYIHTHYQSNVTLSDIAAAGKVCRSRCCQIFTRYMGQSPIDYLIFYRLKKKPGAAAEYRLLHWGGCFQVRF